MEVIGIPVCPGVFIARIGRGPAVQEVDGGVRQSVARFEFKPVAVQDLVSLASLKENVEGEVFIGKGVVETPGEIGQGVPDDPTVVVVDLSIVVFIDIFKIARLCPVFCRDSSFGSLPDAVGGESVEAAHRFALADHGPVADLQLVGIVVDVQLRAVQVGHHVTVD